MSPKMLKLPDPEVDQVVDWIVVNARRTKSLRLLTDDDLARRMCCKRAFVTRLLGGKWSTANSFSLQSIATDLFWIVHLAKALELPIDQLFQKPDDMSLLTQDRRSQHGEFKRRKKLKLTQEQQERLALLDSMGL